MQLVTLLNLIKLNAYFDMKLQVFVHGIDVVEDVLHYPGDDAHCICVVEVPLQTQSKKTDVRELI